MAGWSTACRSTRWCSWSSPWPMSGLPGTSGFVGEFMTLIGTFKVSIPTATFATTGVILSAAYALWLYRKVVFGALTKPSLASIKDLTFREGLIMVPLVALTHPVRLLSEAGARHVGVVGAATRQQLQHRSDGREGGRARAVTRSGQRAMSFESAGYQLLPVLPELVLAAGRDGAADAGRLSRAADHGPRHRARGLPAGR